MLRRVSIRASLLQAGVGLLALALAAYWYAELVVAPVRHAAHWWLNLDVRSVWALLLVGGIDTLLTWWSSSAAWSNWRKRLDWPVARADQPLRRRVWWNWTMSQLSFGALMLGVCLTIAPSIGITPADSNRLIVGTAAGIGIIGGTYVFLARRVRKLERERGVIYFWRREPWLNYDKVPIQGYGCWMKWAHSGASEHALTRPRLAEYT